MLVFSIIFLNEIFHNRCWSYLGRARGMQQISLGDGCAHKGVILHETMHALGFYHEHMRSDRDKYIKIHWENIDSGSKNQFTKLSSSQNKLWAKFDYNSIMIYSSDSFSKNGKDTMEAKSKGQTLLAPYDKKQLSDSDILQIKKAYKCK